MKRCLLAIVILAGCGGGRSLDGEWQLNGMSSGEQPPGAKTTMTFSGQTVTVAMRIDDPRVGAFALDMTGTYTLAGENFTMTMTDGKLDTSKAKPEFKSAIEASVKPEDLKNRLNQDVKYLLKWVSDKEAHLVGAKRSYILKR